MHPQDTVHPSRRHLAYIYLHQTSSTNDYAAETVAINDPNRDLCIYTYNQSAGRGQIGRKWFGDTDKNIACSYTKSFQGLQVQRQFYLNMAFSLAIHDLVAPYVDNPVHIKWPNDIYVADKKIAGILIQNILRADQITNSIMGVGLNVNSLSFPPDLPNPTSISIERHRDQNLLDVVHAMSVCIQRRMADFQNKAPEIHNEYTSLLYRKDQLATFMKDDKQVSGIIKGVLPEGHLVIDIDGKEQHFGFRELSYVI